MLKIESYNGVHRINMSITLLGKQIFPINAYIIEDLLIDTGAANLSKEFLNEIKQFSINTVINTHAHPDHIGSNYAFPYVYVHPKGFEKLKHPQLKMQIQKFLYGLPQPSTPEKIPSQVEAGKYTFEILYTPGHSPDHVSLYEPDKKWAFTGDLLLWGPTREVFVDVKIYDAIESLRALADLDINVLFPGHGPPFKLPKKALAQQVNTLKDMEKKVKAFYKKGMEPEEIRNQLFGRERMYVYLCGGKFSALNLVESYLQGLDT